MSARKPPPRLLTPGEAAGILRVTPRTLARYADDGRLDRVVLNSRATRYTLDSVVALVRQGEVRARERQTLKATSPLAPPTRVEKDQT